MKIFSTVSVCAAMMALAAPLAAEQSPALPGWMAGAWESVDEAGWSDEYWTAPRGGMMIGAARTGKGDALTMWESTRIERKADGSLSFFAQPRGVPASEFPMIASTGAEIEFANAAHDYPQRIRYWRDAEGLHARISLMDGSQAYAWHYVPLGTKRAMRTRR